jgi:hypothetical protein
MLADVIKDKRFNLFFSFVIGLFVAVLLRPQFHKDKSTFFKTPPMKELRDNAYMVGKKCYKFRPDEVECPLDGVIEPFNTGCRPRA